MLLELKNIQIDYGEKTAVKNVSLSVARGEIVGIVGESGSGKSTMLKGILGLLAENARLSAGEVYYRGENLWEMSPSELRRIRGKEISMVFQHPELSFDPIRTIGKSVYESIRVHRPITRKEAYAEARDLFSALHLDDPDRILKSYPFELSGGMCQRTAAAIAMLHHPALLLADEPTSALDVTVQLQVIETMMTMRKTFGTSILIVSHNMGVIAKMADKVGVMQKGELVEWGTKEQVLYAPQHPYTKLLISAIPRMNEKQYNTGGIS